MYPPGSRILFGHQGYGQQPGHEEYAEENVCGQNTFILGVALCACTCCPCGFFIPMDKRRTPFWVVDGPSGMYSTQVGAPGMMRMQQQGMMMQQPGMMMQQPGMMMQQPGMMMQQPGMMMQPQQPGMMMQPQQPGMMMQPQQPWQMRQQQAQQMQSPKTQPMEIVSVRCGGSCGNVVQIQPEGEGLVRFTCPYCQAVNELTYQSRGVTLSNEELKLPDWWRQKPEMGMSALVPVPNDDVKFFQKLLSKTWKDVTTRDRGFKKPQKLVVMDVKQNCNPKLWRNYVNGKHAIRSKMQAAQNHLIVQTKTSDIIDAEQSPMGPLDKDVNEYYLFHGTKPSACKSICESDFMVQLAGTKTGALYGPGIYFAECSSKSDEYAADDPDGIFSHMFALLVCRVTCGRILYDDKVDPDANQLCTACTTGGQFDSVLGDREKARNTYREFVVFKNDQAYPEYVVIYKRVDAD